MTRVITFLTHDAMLACYMR